MNIIIRKAEPCDASIILKAEQEIAQEPGFFCSQPSELSEKNVRSTIDDSNGIYYVAEYNNRIAGHAFLKALPLQSLKHVAQLNIAVHKGFQNLGIGTQLIKTIIEWAKESRSIEKIELYVRASNTQAIALYKKMGFWEEGCLKQHIKIENGYIDDILMALHVKDPRPYRKISRTGVYGVVKENEKILLVIQKSGPFVGLFDLPGGGIEFGETPIQALHREFIEETGMDFKSMSQINNFSVLTQIPSSNVKSAYIFHQIGLIYSVEGLYPSGIIGTLEYEWINFKSLTRERTSPLAWNVLQKDTPENNNLHNRK